MDLVGQHVQHIRIVGRLGRGGMGEVFEGYDETLQRRVAVKMLHPDRRLSAEHTARFLREARILSQLDHPGICRVFDLISTDEADLLVLEFIEGRTLRSVMADALPPTEALRIARDIADALACAHERDIIHRDLKPENVMVAEDGRVRILDFGIARSASQGIQLGIDPGARPPHRSPDGSQAETVDWVPGTTESPSSAPPVLTQLGSVIGTVAYMSPEQAAGEPSTPATDLYALGIMVQEMLTGRRSYGDSSGPDLLLRVYRADVDRARVDDPELDRLVDRMLQLSPSARPTAEETAAEIRRLLDRPRRRRQRRLVTAAAGSVAALMLAAAGLVIHSRWQAANQTRLAESFARRSQAMAWQLRAEYLSPRHDLDPVRTHLRSEVDDMTSDIAGLSAFASAPGRAAIGRTHLALGDIDEAADQLQLAWDAGHRPPEVAYALGVARARQYQRAEASVSVLRSPEAQADERQRIQQLYREPAIAALRDGASSAATFPAYAEGLIALLEERMDDAEDAAERLRDTPPWFYEKSLLAARIHRQRAIRIKEDLGRTEEAEKHLLEAESELQRATETAPSHPELFRELCEAMVLRTQTATIRWTADARDAVMGEAENACTSALELDPSLADAHLLLGRLDTIRAVLALRQGEDPEPHFDRALGHLDRALDVNPDSYRPVLQRAFLHDTRGWFLFQRNPAAAVTEFELAIEGYQRAVTLPMASPLAAANIANSAYGLAAIASTRGEDPTPWTGVGIEVLDPLLEEHPDNRLLWGLKGNLATVAARWTRQTHGETRGFDLAVQAFRRAAEGSDDPMVHCNLALSLSDRADVATATGGDPSDFIDQGLAAADSALTINPEFGRSHQLRGLLLRTRATYLHATGGNAVPPLERAIAAYQRGLETSPDPIFESIDLAAMHLARARVLIDHGQSPGRDLEIARQTAGRMLDVDGTELSATALMAEAAVLEARVARDPAAMLASAEELLETIPRTTRESLGLPSVEIQISLVRAERGPETARLDAARTALDLAAAALQRRPWDAVVAMDLAEARALVERLSGVKPVTDEDSAARALRRVLELNPNLERHPRVARIRHLVTAAP
jgi:tetratricopeptide (TPR) repeat protein